MARMTKQSMPYWAFGVFGMIYFWIDTIMLSLMTRSEVVGWYGATTSLFQTLMFLPVLVQTAWLPRLVAAFVKSKRDLVDDGPNSGRDGADHWSAHCDGHRDRGISPDPRGVWARFAQAVPVLIVLAAVCSADLSEHYPGAVLLAAKRHAVWTGVMAGAAVFNPLVNLVLIPMTEHRFHNGAIGAAISLVLDRGTDGYVYLSSPAAMFSIGAWSSGVHWSVWHRRVWELWRTPCDHSVRPSRSRPASQRWESSQRCFASSDGMSWRWCGPGSRTCGGSSRRKRRNAALRDRDTRATPSAAPVRHLSA